MWTSVGGHNSAYLGVPGLSLLEFGDPQSGKHLHTCLLKGVLNAHCPQTQSLCLRHSIQQRDIVEKIVNDPNNREKLQQLPIHSLFLIVKKQQNTHHTNQKTITAKQKDKNKHTIFNEI